MLTDKALRALKPRSHIYEVADQQGLSIRVNPAGRITFQFRYRMHGKPVRMKLGAYPDMSLAKARAAHQAARNEIDKGIDPAFQKKTEKLVSATAETVSQLAEEFLDRYIKKHRKRPALPEQMLNKDVIPRLGAYKVKDITRRHIVKMLDEIVDRDAPIQANRTASLTKQMFQYAVERGIIDTNPCSDIRRQTIGGTEKSRDRNLTRDEIKTFWKKIDEAAVRRPNEPKGEFAIGLQMAAALKLLLVTAQRRGELAKAKWPDVDFDNATWTIPAVNSKNGRAHMVPLSPLAIKLLRELKGYAGKSKYVLPSTQVLRKGDAHVTERSLTKAAERAQDIVGIPKWVPHDLRRTAASQLAELGVPPHVVEKIQNHTMQGVMAVYNRYDYAKECREALVIWSEELQRITKK